MPIVFTGRVFSIEVEQVPGKNGKTHQIDTVRHRPSVVLLPMKDEGHVILVRQFRHSVGRELWELPAGGLEIGESAEVAAARECEEEIGWVPGRIERLRDMFPAPGFCDEVLVYFRLSELRPPDPSSPHKPDEDEDIQARVFSIAEAKAMLDRGEIIDLKTAFGLSML